MNDHSKKTFDERLMPERLYSVASIIRSPQSAARDVAYTERDEMTGFKWTKERWSV